MRLRAASVCLLAAIAGDGATGSFTKTVQPFVAENCVVWHNGETLRGGLDLQSHVADFTSKDRDVWERVAVTVKAGEVPPKPLPGVKEDDVDGFVGFMESEYARIDRKTPPDPGRVTARRLVSRREPHLGRRWTPCRAAGRVAAVVARGAATKRTG